MTAAIVVDGAYAYHSVRDIDSRYQPDFRKLRSLVEERFGPVVDSYYLNSVAPDFETDLGAQRFYDYLQRPTANGGAGFKTLTYGLKQKPLLWPDKTPVVHPITGEPFLERKQRGVDVGIALHTILSFVNHNWKHLVFFGGDSDFYETLEQLAFVERVKITIVGTKQSISPSLLDLGIPWYLDDYKEILVSPRTKH